MSYQRFHGRAMRTPIQQLVRFALMWGAVLLLVGLAVMALYLGTACAGTCNGVRGGGF